MGGTRKNPSGEVVLKTGVLWELCQAQAKQRERMKGKHSTPELESPSPRVVYLYSRV